MDAIVELGYWNRVIGLPYLILFSYRFGQGKLYKSQLKGFVHHLEASAKEHLDGLLGQLLDDALKEWETKAKEMGTLSPPALITATRQAIYAARKSLDESTAAGYLEVMLSLNREMQSSQPFYAVLLGAIAHPCRTAIPDAIRAMLMDELAQMNNDGGMLPATLTTHPDGTPA
jgi:hypothetical protein